MSIVILGYQIVTLFFLSDGKVVCSFSLTKKRLVICY